MNPSPVAQPALRPEGIGVLKIARVVLDACTEMWPCMMSRISWLCLCKGCLGRRRHLGRHTQQGKLCLHRHHTGMCWAQCQ